MQSSITKDQLTRWHTRVQQAMVLFELSEYQTRRVMMKLVEKIKFDLPVIDTTTVEELLPLIEKALRMFEQHMAGANRLMRELPEGE